MPSDPLDRAPVQTVDDAVKLMADLEASLPDNDGVKWFNHLYLSVTRSVRQQLAGGGHWNDPAFLARLDVIFANLYFAAAAAARNGSAGAPPAWRPLFDCRSDGGIARVQFALAGMNAHINRDLVLAIVQTYQAAGGSPSHGDPRYADFTRVNDLLAAVEEQVKQDFISGPLSDIDQVAAPLDDVLAMWDVRVARETAWRHAEALWHLQHTPLVPAAVGEQYFAALDGTVGLAGRGLLVHIR